MPSELPPEVERAAAEDAERDREAEYYQRVERHFGLRRGGPLMLSPRDWKLVQRWYAEGIPLPIVLRGINRAFDRFAASGPRVDRINSLGYCGQHIAQEWERHRELAAAEGGAHDSAETGPFQDAVEHLSRAAGACRRAADDGRLPGTVLAALNEAAESLEALARDVDTGGLDTQALDERAGQIEATLLEGVRIEETIRARAGGIADVRDRLHLPPFSPYGL